jgi:glycosyltransferase 2 family protein
LVADFSGQSLLKLPLKPLLLVLGGVASLYAVALVLAGDVALGQLLMRLASPTGMLTIALCLLNFVLRGLRWRLWMAHYQRSLGVLEGLRLYLAGYTFTPTPGNIGEAARGMLLAHQPLSPAQSLSIFGAERLADLLCLLLLCLPGVGWLLLQAPASLVAWWPVAALIVGLGALLFSVLWRRFKQGLVQRFSWLQAAWQCLTTRPLLWFSLTLVAWAAQGVALWLICVDSGLAIPVLLASGFYAIAMVGGALAMLPAGLGGMEALLTGLLISQGAATGVALGITLLVRLLTLWLAVAIGAVALLYSAAIKKDISLK